MHVPPHALTSAPPTILSIAQSPPFTRHVGTALEDQFRAACPSSNQVTSDNAFQRGDHGHAIVERVDRAVVAFAEAPHGCVGVERDDERGAEGAGLARDR